MSSTIESKVVEMKFDNSNFEKNVSTSMSTLDKLKEKLNLSDAASSFADVTKEANKVDFSGIENSLSALESRFSTAGVAMMTIVSNITTAAMNGVSNIASKVSSLIASGGLSRAMNIEQAKFQLEGMSIAWDDVSDSIDYAVTNTAYGLDSAALAASTLAASGVSIGDVAKEVQTVGDNGETTTKQIDSMAVSLRAISGVAAMTNRDYSSIADIFSTIAGNGKLMTMQLRQFSSAGLNVAATLAKSLGKTEAEIYEMVEKGEIDYATFADVMFDNFADHATEANRTVTGVLSNIRSAFAKIGAEFISPIIENDGPLVNMLEALRVNLNAIKDQLKPLATFVTDNVIVVLNKVTELLKSFNAEVIDFSEGSYALKTVQWIFEAIEAVAKQLMSVLSPLGKAFSAVLGDIVNPLNSEYLASFLLDIKEIAEDLTLNSKESDKLQRAFEGLFSVFKIGLSVALSLIEAFENILVILSPIGNLILDVAANVGDALTSIGEHVGYDLQLFEVGDKTVQKYANGIQFVIDGLTHVFEEFGKVAGIVLTGLFGEGGILDTRNLPTGFGDLMSTWFNFLSGVDGTNFLDTCVHIRNELNKFEISEDVIEKLTKTVNGLVDAFGYGEWDSLDDISDKFEKFGINLDQGVVQKFKDVADSLKNFLSTLRFDTSGFKQLSDDVTTDLNIGQVMIEGFLTFIEKFVDFLSGVSTLIQKVAKAITDSLKELFSGYEDGHAANFEEIFGMASLPVILTFLKDAVLQIRKLVESFSTFDPSRIVRTFENLTTAIGDITTAMSNNAKGDLLLKAAASIMVLAVALQMLSNLDEQQLANSLVAITAMMTELMAMLKVFDSMSVTNDLGLGLSSAGTSLMKISAAILILAIAMKEISELDIEALGKGMLAITVLLAEMTAVMKVLDSESGSMMKGASALIAMAAAIAILVIPIKQLGEMDNIALSNGLLSVCVLLAAMAVVAKTVDGTKLTSVGIGMVGVAAAISILSGACKTISEIPDDKLVTTIGTVLALMTAMSLFANVTNDLSKMISLGAGLVLVAASMQIFASAMSSIGEIPIDQLEAALVSISALLVLLTTMSRVADGATMITMGLGLVAFGSGLLIVAQAAAAFGDMGLENLVKATIAIGSISAIMVVLSLIDGAKLLVTAVAFNVMAGAMMAFAPALAIMGALDVKTIVTGLVTLAAAFAIIGAAAYLLSPVIVNILALAGAFVLIGAGVTLLAVGLTGIGAGLTSCAAGLVAFTAALGTSFVALLASLGQFCLTLIDYLGQIVVLICQKVIEMAPYIAEAVVTLLAAIGKILVEGLPQFVEDALETLLQIIQLFVEYTPKITAGVAQIILSILTTLSEYMPQITAAAVTLIVNFVDGLAQGLEDNAEKIGESLRKLCKAMLKVVLSFFGIHSPSTVMADVGKNLILGLIEGVTNKITSIVSTMGELCRKAYNKVKDWISSFKTVGGNLIAGLKNGINDKMQEVVDAATGVVSKAVGAVKRFLGIASPSKLFAEIGKYSDLGIVKGLEDYSDNVSNAATNVSEDALTAMKDGFDSAADAIDGDLTYSPVISPVLDLTNVNNGASSLDSLFGNKSIGLASGSSRSISNKIQEEIKMGANNVYSDDNVISAISSLREDFATMTSAIEGMQIRMDSGVLVGQLVNGMDTALGKRYAQAGRSVTA